MDTQDSQDLKFYTSKLVTICALIGLIPVSYISGLFLVSNSTNLNDELISGAIFTLSALLIFWSAYKIVLPKPLLIVNEQGLIIGDKIILWKDIESFSLVPLYLHGVSIYGYNIKISIVNSNPYNLTTSTLSISATSLLEILKQRMAQSMIVK